MTHLKPVTRLLISCRDDNDWDGDAGVMVLVAGSYCDKDVGDVDGEDDENTVSISKEQTFRGYHLACGFPVTGRYVIL